MSVYKRKLRKFGNSYGITIPKELLEKVALTQDDLVAIYEKEGKIILHKEEKKLPSGVDANFMKVLNEVNKEHDKALRELVDR